jgi:hypothetical protein
MFKWIDQYNEATPQTKFFILNWVVYGLAIVITTIYCYARLDFVRSYQTPSTIETKQTIEKKT